jgi:SHS family lactate transporter-like MFS transporter
MTADDSIIICLCYTACWIPLWILPSSFGGLAAGGFFIQSGVQGAWGVVPIYLGESFLPLLGRADTYTGEISPPAFRASFGGLAYQLGNMASSAAAQIEATAGESLKLKGTNIPDYVGLPSCSVVRGWG